MVLREPRGTVGQRDKSSCTAQALCCTIPHCGAAGWHQAAHTRTWVLFGKLRRIGVKHRPAERRHDAVGVGNKDVTVLGAQVSGLVEAAGEVVGKVLPQRRPAGW